MKRPLVEKSCSGWEVFAAAIVV